MKIEFKQEESSHEEVGSNKLKSCGYTLIIHLGRSIEAYLTLMSLYVSHQSSKKNFKQIFTSEHSDQCSARITCNARNKGRTPLLLGSRNVGSSSTPSQHLICLR